MRITIVGPGIMPIPPTGWGAVEILIWDYKENLEALGHEVVIVNTQNKTEIINQVNASNPDFVHVQYDDFYGVTDSFECKNVGITSHFGYLEQPGRYGGYANIFNGFKYTNANILSLSEGIKNQYLLNGVSPDRLWVVPNGVRTDLFRFDENCEFEERSMYLAKIDPRKRQVLFQSIPDLYFAGNIADSRFNKNSSQYLGEWSKEHLYDNLTRYANLVLLSDGEAHPLVCMEALSAGLGLVISQCASANLDLDLPFIDVIPEDKINNIPYVSEVIRKNRENSIGRRQEIRDYAIEKFSWENIVKNYYLPTIESIIEKNA